MKPSNHWEAEYYLPHGSADGLWRVIDADSDNGDTIAAIDPHENYGERAQERIAATMAAALEMLAALQGILPCAVFQMPHGIKAYAISDDRMQAAIDVVAKLPAGRAGRTAQPCARLEAAPELLDNLDRSNNILRALMTGLSGAELTEVQTKYAENLKIIAKANGKAVAQ